MNKSIQSNRWRPMASGLAAGIVCLLSVSATAWGAVYTNYVALAGDDANGGAAWGDAYLTITQAVAQARGAIINAGAEAAVVNVGPGTFNVAVEVLLDQPIAIVGQGHAGPQSIIRQTSASKRVYVLSNATAELDGLVVENGQLSSAANTGGNVLMTAGTMTNCVIRGNRDVAGTATRNAYGGGISMTTGCLVTDCVVSNNVVSAARATGVGARKCYGGGVYMTGGTLRRTLVSGNAAFVAGGTAPSGISANGGGVYIDNVGAVVENCLIANNRIYQKNTTWTPQSLAGCGALLNSGTLRNCTIVANTYGATSGTVYGGGVRQLGGAMVNCIVSSNTATIGQDYQGTQQAVTYSCAPELVLGTGNIPYPPLFVNSAANDYRLQYGSPCVDTGSNLTGVVTDDFAGNPRPVDGLGMGAERWDMGAYEALAATSRPTLVCSPVADRTIGLAPMADVVLTACVGGPSAATNVVYYWWDFGGGGIAQEGADKRVATNTFATAGAYTVTLTVSNSLGQTASGTQANYIVAMGSTVYVATNGVGIPPYQNWSNATPVFDVALYLAKEAIALGAAGAQVMVGTGTFSLAEEAVIDKPIIVTGADATNSILRQTVAHRVMSLTDGSGIVENVALANGGRPAGSYYGSGVYMTTGLVRNCEILDNNNGPSSDSSFGGGVAMIGGMVEGCTIMNNSAYNYYRGQGGGVFMGGGILRRSIVAYNMARNTSAGGTDFGSGAGVFMTDGIVENCVIRNNTLQDSFTDAGGGGGARVIGGTLRNCTLVINTCAGANVGGGVRQTGGTVVNCIVWSNTVAAGIADTNYSGTAQDVTYSCAPELASGEGNKTGDPLFVAALEGNYRLATDSPAVNAGLNQPAWMAAATDLDGTPRIQAGRVDMGAYEWVPPRGTVLTVR